MQIDGRGFFSCPGEPPEKKKKNSPVTPGELTLQTHFLPFNNRLQETKAKVPHYSPVPLLKKNIKNKRPTRFFFVN